MPIPIAAAILGSGVASSLLGGITSAISQNSANHTNIKLAQMSNDFQREMYEKQVADEWRQIEYNTPVNQVNRLKQAGLNPNLMMNGGSAGNASGSVTTGGNPATAHVDPTIGPSASQLLSQASEQLFDFLLQKKQVDKLGAETQGLQIDNQYKVQEILSRINNMKADTFSKDAKRQLDEMNTKYLRGNYDNFIKQQQANIAFTEQQTALLHSQQILTDFQANLSEKELKVFDDKLQADLSLKAAQAYQAYANGNMSYAQAKLAISNAVESAARTSGIRIDNNIKERSADALVRSAFNQNTIAYQKAQNMINYGVEQAGNTYNFGGSGEFSGQYNFGMGSVSGKVSGDYHSSGYRRRKTK